MLGSLFFISCTENIDLIPNKNEGVYTRLLVSPFFDTIHTKNRSYSGDIDKHLEFQDGDSLLLVNISNGFHSKMIYNSTLSSFEGDVILNPKDEISVVYPYKNIPIISNHLLVELD